MTIDEVWEVLKAITDIEGSQNIVDAKRVGHVDVDESKIYVLLSIPFEAQKSFYPLRDKIEQELKSKIRGEKKVLVGMTATKKSAEQADLPKTHKSTPLAKYVIAVGSGKGGVGKSTVTLAIASSLAKLHGLRVGLLDSDVHGPSIPHLMQTSSKPKIINNKLIPIEKWGIYAMSLGMLVEGNAASILRGPMMGRAVEQMIDDVNWPPLDVLLLDFPPGTGDVHLSSFRKLSMTGVVIVSTPQDLALLDAGKMMQMCDRLEVPVIGLIENMSGFACPYCGTVSDIFGKNGVKQRAKELSIPYLGSIPLHQDLREYSDKGKSLLHEAPLHPVSTAYAQIVDTLIASLELL